MNVFVEIKKRIKPMVCGGMREPQWVPLRGLLEVIDQVEKEYNNGWILCSERLPEDREIKSIADFFSQSKLICTKVGIVSTAVFINGKFISTDTCSVKFPEVIAWQELPESVLSKAEMEESLKELESFFSLIQQLESFFERG